MLYNKGWEVMRVTDVICGDDHEDKVGDVEEFVSFSVGEEEKDDDEHLYSDEDVFTIETEGVSLVEAITGCQYVSA